MKNLNWLLLWLLPCSMVHADDTVINTGTDLHNECRAYTQFSPMPWGYKMLDTNPSIGICLTYMGKLIEQNTAGQGHTGLNYCLPKDITPGQLAVIYVTYADKNPQSLPQETTHTLNDLLGRAFPCNTRH